MERRLVHNRHNFHTHILDFLGQSLLIVRNLLDAAKPVDYPLLKPLPLAFQDAEHTDQVAAPKTPSGSAPKVGEGSPCGVAGCMALEQQMRKS